jgi:hypothetical protein
MNADLFDIFPLIIFILAYYAARSPARKSSVRRHRGPVHGADLYLPGPGSFIFPAGVGFINIDASPRVLMVWII